jgi:hypothetical protein
MMKFFDVDWTQIFAFLPAWDAMSPSSRKAFLNPAHNHVQSPPGTIDKDDLKSMVQAGLIREGAPGRFKPSESSGVLFRRVFMQMSKFPLFDPPFDRQQMEKYVDKHFLQEDAARMCHGLGDWRQKQSSEGWLRAFLESDDPRRWEDAYKEEKREDVRLARRNMWHGGYSRQDNSAKVTYFTSEAVAEAARALVKLALDSPAPLPLRLLSGGALPGVDARTTADAFKAAVRYLLLFPALRADSYEAVFWIRPNLGARRHRAPAERPKPVSVEEFTIPPFFLGDASILVAHALTKPLRIKKRSWGTDLFEKVMQELVEALGDLPEPVGNRFPRRERVTLALALLLSLKFLSKSSSCLSATQAGAAWLRQSASDRLRALLDAFRKHRKVMTAVYVGGRAEPLSFAPLLLFHGARYNAKLVDTAPWIEAVWAEANRGQFFLLEEWLAYHSRTSMPPHVEPDAALIDPITGRQTTAEEGGEEIFKNFHKEFFFARLIPLGGVRLGYTSDGQLAFSLNETGSYLLRGEGAPAPVADAVVNVVVQPNFEIVFMQPSTLAEAELARFAERCGHRVGALFRITKRSVVEAARLGITADGVLETLTRISSKPLPENVRHQIHDWFRGCRDVEVRRSILLTVPDEETAQRLLRELGEKCSKIAPRTLELRAAKIEPKVAKKLDSLGIFLRNP